MIATDPASRAPFISFTMARISIVVMQMIDKTVGNHLVKRDSFQFVLLKVKDIMTWFIVGGYRTINYFFDTTIGDPGLTEVAIPP